MMFAIVTSLNGNSKFTLRFADRWYGVLLLSGIFTLGMVYHYVVPLNAVLYSNGIAGNDSGQMIWNLWSVNEAITSGHNPYQTTLLYYPKGANLSHHTLGAGFFPVTFLVKLFSGSDDLYPIYAARVITLMCFTLLLFFSYLVVRELGCTRLASATVAVAYAFGDFYMAHALHLNLIAGFFIPLIAFLLVRSYKRPASMNLVCSAFAAAAAVYFTEFALYIYIAALLFTALALLFSEERRRLLLAWQGVGPKRMTLALAVFIFAISPFLISLSRDRVIKPTAAESSLFSANLAGFFIPGPQHTLLARVFAPLSSRVTSGAGAFEEFIGFTLLAFGAVGMILAGRKLVLCAGLTALVFYVLSLGPTLKIFGADTGVPLPYAVLMNLPPFDNGRTPVRFVSVATFFLMIPAAIGLSRIQQTLVARWGNVGSVAMVVLLAMTVAEAYSPIRRQQSFVAPRDLRQRVTGPVFNIPLRALDGYAALLQVFHRQPIATGYVARDSAERRIRFEELKKVYDRGGPEFCDRIAELGFQSIVITRGDVLVPLELSKCKLPVVDLRSEVSWEPDDSVSTKSDVPQFPSLAFGQRVDFSAATADPYLWYGWSGREATARWTDRGSAAIVFSLEAVRASVLRLEMAPFVAPPRLASQTVLIKLNGRQVASVTLSNPQHSEYSIQLPIYLVRKENVLTFELPDAQAPKAMGVSEDARLLGISVRSMRVD
jgi:hypothetical protein